MSNETQREILHRRLRECCPRDIPDRAFANLIDALDNRTVEIVCASEPPSDMDLGTAGQADVAPEHAVVAPEYAARILTGLGDPRCGHPGVIDQAAYEKSPSPLDMAVKALEAACESPRRGLDMSYINGIPRPYAVKLFLVDEDGTPLLDDAVYTKAAGTMLAALQLALQLIEKDKKGS